MIGQLGHGGIAEYTDRKQVASDLDADANRLHSEGETSVLLMPHSKCLQPGDPAPDFTLPDGDGKMVSLADFRGRNEVVLFFYPKDNTPGCTREACSFRDSFEAFCDAGAEVIGISSDSGDSHRQFAQRFRLPFVLLSDPEGTARARYGVAKTLGILPGRVTFLIDRQGIIRFVFASQFQPAQHVARALRALEELRTSR
jgi:peroxiredoxin Q/BCP